MSFLDLFANFFTHKDFLPPANEIPGTMFTWLHFLFSAIVIAILVVCIYFATKISDKAYKNVLIVLWVSLVIAEVVKILWETFSGKQVDFFIQGMLPLYPCSLFMYTLPFIIFGKDIIRHAACGYMCTLGIVGGLINFVYPATILGSYSAISFAGFHTFFYHGSMVFVAVTLLLRKWHSYTGIDSVKKYLVTPIPILLFSIPVNIVNFTLNADYCFFKCESFILAPIGAALPTPVTVILMYIFYILVALLPYTPSFIKNCKKQNKAIAD